jgi:hypothetical protein
MTINSPEGRWSISLCNCSQDTIHFYYGNATLHILVRDVRELGMAMQRMAERLESQNGADGKKKALLQ